MACPLCGEQCSCSYAPVRPDRPAAVRTALADGDDFETTEQRFLASLDAPSGFASSSDHGILGSSNRAAAADSERARRSSDLLTSNSNWRQEVATRVQDFRARRARRRSADETLTFQFEPPSPDSWNTGRTDSPAVAPAQFDYYRSLTAQALARLDAARAAAAEQEEENALAIERAHSSPAVEEPPEPEEEAPRSDTAEQYFGWHDGAAIPAPEPDPAPKTPYLEEPAPEGKIIEFPRPPVIIPPSSEELAEPVLDKPRILDVPEAVPTANAPLAGIRLEPAEEEPFSSFQVELPLAVASLSQRVFAGLVDATLVAAASALYLGITLQMKVPLPSGKFAAVMLAALPFTFWMLYNYLFLVHGAATPGMKLSRLRVTSFEGESVSARERRWRAITMGLSAVSLGLGLVWAIFDEDTLCWHDRITRTYLTTGQD